MSYYTTRLFKSLHCFRFTSCWTIITASVASFLFIHPDWSRQPISSIGSQALWIFITWILWILSAGLLNAAVPSLLVKRSCANIVYCGQIRSLFGECEPLHPRRFNDIWTSTWGHSKVRVVCFCYDSHMLNLFIYGKFVIELWHVRADVVGLAVHTRYSSARWYSYEMKHFKVKDNVIGICTLSQAVMYTAMLQYVTFIMILS